MLSPDHGCSQEPHMEVISPGTKSLQTYVGSRLLVYIYREFRANEKRGLVPRVRADELSAQFPNLSEPFLRKRLKHCAELQVALPFVQSYNFFLRNFLKCKLCNNVGFYAI